MIGLIALIAAIAVGVFGFRAARTFTARRLRYTAVAEHPGASAFAAALGATLLAAPVAAFLPVVGAGTALALGAGVGTGVVAGTRGRLPDDI